MLYSSLIQFFYSLPAALLLAINIPATLHAQDDIEVPAAYAHLTKVEGEMFKVIAFPEDRKTLIRVDTAWNTLSKKQQKRASRTRKILTLYADTDDTVRLTMLMSPTADWQAKMEAQENLTREKNRQAKKQKNGPAPVFEVTSMQGEIISLKELSGRPVVLNFWFVDCSPCRKEIPKLNELVHTYEGQDAVFLAIALDGKERLEDFLSTTSFAYIVSPSGRSSADLYNITSYPASIVIDRDGKITYQRSGLGPGSIASLKRALKKAVKG